MNALLALLALAICVSVSLLIPAEGPAAVLACAALAAPIIYIVSRQADHGLFLAQVFAAALVMRMGIGSIIHIFNLQDFFGGDALTYDIVGETLLSHWRNPMSGTDYETIFGASMTRNWGMAYLVAGIYSVTGRNMLAVQFFNAVVGAATAPVIFLCARHIFQNLRVAYLTTLLVAFFPSLVLWSSQGLKDGPIIFLLAVSMLATLKLGERFSAKYVVVLLLALYGLFTLRFYVFYMTLAATGGAFLIGMRAQTTSNIARQVIIVMAMGVAFTYLGVLRGAGAQLEVYGDLEAVQRSRADLATTANSGFAQDVDVSTTTGALSAIPIGLIYLLFAPFPWQLANLRQSITLPEMLVWWVSFPMLVLGAWFTVKYRLRQALPILIFTSMLTLAYSIFQGNVGTAYRQRAQLLVFYFIFVSVGVVLIRERRENQRLLRELKRAEEVEAAGRRASAPLPSSLPVGVQARPAAAAAHDILKLRAGG
jgi:hypothetical protein